QGGLFLLRFQIPKFGGLVIADCRQGAALWAIGDRIDRTLVSTECSQFLAGGGSPQRDLAEPAAGRERLVVTGEGDGKITEFLERAQLGTASRIPEPELSGYRPVEPARHQYMPVWRKSQGQAVERHRGRLVVPGRRLRGSPTSSGCYEHNHEQQTAHSSTP